MKKFITFLSIMVLNLLEIFSQVTIISPSPNDGETLENPPTFKFRTTANGCYVFVITPSQNGCTQNSGVWNSSLSSMYSGNSYETTVPQSVWNSLADGTTYWWHISYRLVDCPSTPLPYHSECRRFTKAPCTSPSNIPIPTSPCGNAQIDEARPTLNWNPNSSNTNVYYQIQISESSSFSSYVEQQDGIPGNVTSYRVLTSLTDKKTYYWRIRAYR
ncbi:MAG: hypothetical protein N2560_05660, partial [Ignavibacteria bacterium]|nr:hypothetical protein [Ignavibacteria bacterium]